MNYSLTTAHVDGNCSGPGYGHIVLRYRRTFKYPNPNAQSFPQFNVSETATITGTPGGSESDVIAHSKSLVDFKPLEDNGKYMLIYPFPPPIVSGPWTFTESPSSATYDFYIELTADVGVGSDWPNGTSASTADGTIDYSIWGPPPFGPGSGPPGK